MKINATCVVSALVLFAATGVHAADANKANVYRDYTDTVAPADQDAYEAAVKAFNQCLREHGVKYSWVAWGHETGNTYKYSYIAGPVAWADFDTMHTQMKPCDSTWRTKANAHLKGETSAFMVEQADMSHEPKGGDKNAVPQLIDVIFFTVKEGRDAHEAFTGAVKKIAAAADKSGWSSPFRTFEVRRGDVGAPDYVVLLPNKNWADVGTEPNPPLWKMVEGVYGKADADALRKSFGESIKDSSSHIDSYNEELTYSAPKK